MLAGRWVLHLPLAELVLGEAAQAVRTCLQLAGPAPASGGLAAGDSYWWQKSRSGV